jgi:hypothetical protein
MRSAEKLFSVVVVVVLVAFSACRRAEPVKAIRLIDVFKKDSLNKTDVASEHRDVVERLGKALDEWRQKAAAAKLKPDSDSTRNLTPAQLQRLRSLGYIR